jgi:hypothetical protein
MLTQSPGQSAAGAVLVQIAPLGDEVLRARARAMSQP